MTAERVDAAVEAMVRRDPTLGEWAPLAADGLTAGAELASHVTATRVLAAVHQMGMCCSMVMRRISRSCRSRSRSISLTTTAE